MSDPLSPDELASLLDDLPELTPSISFDDAAESEPVGIAAADEPVPASAPPAPASREVERFALGQRGGRSSERLTILERMGDRIARGLREVIEPFSRLRPHLPTASVEVITFGEWQEALPGFMSLSQYRLRPLKGGMLLTLDPRFIASLVESFYGGTGAAPRARDGHDLTASEDMLITRLRAKIMGLIESQWNELTPVEPVLLAHETSFSHLAFVRREEPVAVHRFAIQVGAIETEIAFVYPLAMVRPIEARLAEALIEDEDPTANELWRLKLGTALAHVRLPVRSVLARPEISVAELLALKPGDVIPISLAPNTPLLAGQHRIADGVIGEQDGRAALMIEKIGKA